MGNKVDTKQVKKLFKQLDGLPLDTMKKAFPFLKKETPIKSGNARRKTSLKSSTLKIKSKYAYAGRLDDGWSKQAPDGFTDPTIDFIEDYIESQIRKL
tara:strand:- start:11745 stop:12038 length:294 start_codon:yes stop_codon:yes gene_type:complete